MRRSIFGTVAVAITVLAWGSTARAERGEVVAHFPGDYANNFVHHPTLPYMYASLANQQRLAIFNTQTLALEQTFPIGPNPTGLTIAPDGSELYVARNDGIAVFDTATRTIARTLPFGDAVTDVAVGAANRLWVCSLSGVFPMDRTTGAIVGATLPLSHFGGQLEISPDRDTLYYGQFGVTGSRMFEIDVSTEPAAVLWGSPGSGADLTLSHDGSFISYDTQLASSNGFARRRTSDMAVAGHFDAGWWSGEIAFSPDDAKAYLSRPRSQGEWIDVIDAATLAAEAPFAITGEAVELRADRTGQWLFVSSRFGPNNDVGIYILDTGRVIPEPAALSLLLLPLALLRRRREVDAGHAPFLRVIVFAPSRLRG